MVLTPEQAQMNRFEHTLAHAPTDIVNAIQRGCKWNTKRCC